MPEKRNIKVLHLDNNIRLVLEHIPHTEVVSLGINVGAGSVTETPESMGYSHLLEHMVFKGTKNRDYIEINRDIEKYGGFLNAFTDKHYTFFYVKILGEYLNQAIDVLLDIVYNPIFPENELEKEKKVVLEEIAMYDDNPEENVIDMFYEKTYPNSFMGWPILGKESNIKNANKDSLYEYWNKFYQNDNIIISVSGKFEEKDIVQLIERIKNKGKSEKKETQIPIFKPGINYKEREVEQVHLALGLKTFSLYDEKRYVLSLFNHILGGTSSSRLYLSIREKLGLCYSINSLLGLDKDVGHMMVLTSTKDENLGKILDGVRKEFANFKSLRVSSEELNIAKAQLKSNILFSLENVSYCMQKNANNLFWHNELVPHSEIIKKIEKVSIDDIHRLYEELFEKGTEASLYAILPYNSKKGMPEKLTV